MASSSLRTLSPREVDGKVVSRPLFLRARKGGRPRPLSLPEASSQSPSVTSGQPSWPDAPDLEWASTVGLRVASSPRAREQEQGRVHRAAGPIS